MHKKLRLRCARLSSAFVYGIDLVHKDGFLSTEEKVALATTSLELNNLLKGTTVHLTLHGNSRSLPNLSYYKVIELTIMNTTLLHHTNPSGKKEYKLRSLAKLQEEWLCNPTFLDELRSLHLYTDVRTSAIDFSKSAQHLHTFSFFGHDMNAIKVQHLPRSITKLNIEAVYLDLGRTLMRFPTLTDLTLRNLSKVFVKDDPHGCMSKMHLDPFGRLRVLCLHPSNEVAVPALNHCMFLEHVTLCNVRSPNLNASAATLVFLDIGNVSSRNANCVAGFKHCKQLKELRIQFNLRFPWRIEDERQLELRWSMREIDDQFPLLTDIWVNTFANFRIANLKSVHMASKATFLDFSGCPNLTTIEPWGKRGLCHLSDVNVHFTSSMANRQICLPGVKIHKVVVP